MATPINLISFVIRREQRLRSEEGRQNFEILWQQISRYCIPRKAHFKEQLSPGQERTRYIFDSTAPRSLELFASFIHTLMNNPATFWFELAAKNRGRKVKSQAAKAWLEEVREIMLDAMTRNVANVYTHLHQLYIDLGAFGTGVMYVDSMRDADDDLRLIQYHLGDCVIGLDENFLVNELHRKFQYTGEQARAKWEKANLGKGIERELVNDPSSTKKFNFIHSVVPNTKRIRRLIPNRLHNFPFISIWTNKDDNQIVATGGFEEFPYQVPRWYVMERERYGRSPAMTVMPDIRMINRMKDTMIRGLEKIVDPPLLLPDGGMVSPIRLSPGSISFSEGSITPELLIPSNGAGIQLGQFEIKEVQTVIREGFFIPLFATPESPVKTATQVLQEADERNRAVSPMLVRLQAELLDPLIRRIFLVMFRAGAFPEAPAEMQGSEIQVAYNSPLIASQKQAESLGAVRLIQGLEAYVAVSQDTSVFDKIDPDEFTDVIFEGSGAPARIMRSEVDLREFRQQSIDDENRAEQAQLAIQGAGAIADLAKANVIPTQQAA